MKHIRSHTQRRFSVPETGPQKIIHKLHIPRRDSVFFQTWAVLMSVFFLLSLLFVLSMNRVENSHRREQAGQLNLELLSEASAITELGLSHVRTNIGELIWDTDMVAFFMDPESTEISHQYQAAQLLSSSVENNSWICSAWVYSELSDQILTADGQLTDRNDFEDRAVIDARPSVSDASDPEAPEANARLLILGSRLFWVEDFVTSRSIGCLCMEINRNTLCRCFSDESQNPIGLYDAEGNLLSSRAFAGNLPDILGFSDSDSYLNGDSSDFRKARYYTEYNPSLNLYFVRRIDSSALKMDLPSMLLFSVPFILVLSLIGLLASWYVARRIYQPINQLVRQVLSRTSGTDSASYTAAVSGTDSSAPPQARVPSPGQSRELNYLELSFFHAMDRNEALTDTMRRFSRDILEQVFRKLLQGSTEEEAGFPALDEESRLPWQNGRHFCVIACRRTNIQNIADPFLDSQLFLAGITQIVEARTGDGLMPSHLIISMGPSHTAILLSSAKSVSATDLANVAENLCRAIVNHLSPACPAAAAGSAVFTERAQFSDRWREALRQADYQAYLQSPRSEADSSSGNSPEAEDKPAVFRDSVYGQNLLQLLQLVLTDQRPEAVRSSQHLLDSFWESNPTPGEAAAFAVSCTSLLVETLLLQHGIRIDSVPSIAEKDLSPLSPEDQRKMVRQCIDSILNQTETGSQRKSSRYMEEAVAYILENYENRDLGLQDVADHLGLNSNYFSSLFNEAMNTSFTNYLNQIRVEQAGYLLTGTQMTIRDIGFRCGFNTVQHFNRVFKKFTGMPPSQFRRGQQ